MHVLMCIYTHFTQYLSRIEYSNKKVREGAPPTRADDFPVTFLTAAWYVFQCLENHQISPAHTFAEDDEEALKARASMEGPFVPHRGNFPSALFFCWGGTECMSICTSLLSIFSSDPSAIDSSGVGVLLLDVRLRLEFWFDVKLRIGTPCWAIAAPVSYDFDILKSEKRGRERQI